MSSHGACDATEPRTRDASLRSAEGARMLTAPRAVAVTDPAEGRRHLEADATAEARDMEWVLRARLVRWTRPGHDESLVLADRRRQPEDSDRGVGAASGNVL